jgi:hypothetical protein
VGELKGRLARGDSVYLHDRRGTGRAALVGAALLADVYGWAPAGGRGEQGRARQEAGREGRRRVRGRGGWRRSGRATCTPCSSSSLALTRRTHPRPHSSPALTRVTRRLSADEALERVQRSCDTRCDGGAGVAPESEPQRAAVRAFVAARRA